MEAKKVKETRVVQTDQVLIVNARIKLTVFA
ncbi:Acyl-CoA hydrolase [Cytobacillus firmus]|uniref:Acyl-CoA hydrolase n=1 Tax=Cytobacillus firmus TaxID=1399 RepID=A0A800N993_CYTFI|nr:Acyl-CoA hydrolase [Cytobacillus firmus]